MWGLWSGDRIGSQADDIRRDLGEPRSGPDDVWVYRLEPQDLPDASIGGAVTRLLLIFSQDRLAHAWAGPWDATGAGGRFLF